VGAELESLLDQPDVRTARAFLEQLYHPHPYSRALHGDPASLACLDAAGCAEHHRRSLTWGGCAVVTGQVDEARVGRRLEELFGHLDQAAGELPPVPPPLGLPEVHREVLLPGSEQAHLYAGHTTVPRNHPSMPALDLLGVVLGAGAGLSGRLPERIREREGLAYTVDCATASGAGIDPGRLVVYAGTSPKTAAQAEKAVREELRRLVDEGVEKEELEEARSYLIGRDPFRRETARQWADLLAEAELYGLPTDRPGWQVERLRALRHRDVEEVARCFLRPDDVRVTLGVPG
jgi:predicted Zn-dependent peptidase